MKHTPAPWKYREQSTANGSFFRVEGETVKVANIVTRDFETAKSNALLVAAAPELLQALIKMCEWHEKQATYDKGDNGYYLGKRLINKATGNE